MEQLTLYDPPFKYIIDSSSILSQKPHRSYRRNVHKTLWPKVEKYLEEHIIVTCSEIADEVKDDDDVKGWLERHNCYIIPIDYEIQDQVTQIVNKYPNMISFSDRGSSSGDAFLIATAIKYRLDIITEERHKKYQIPTISQQYGIKTYSIIELCDVENWEL